MLDWKALGIAVSIAILAVAIIVGIVLFFVALGPIALLAGFLLILVAALTWAIYGEIMGY